MLAPWLRALSDDDLVVWGSRGLLRRGTKLLASVAPSALELTPTGARASLEGHELLLGGVGFAQASCTCPATGPCHHLVAFFLALRARAAECETEPEAQPPPWRDPEGDEWERQLGRAHVRRARRWMAQGIELTWEETEAGLRATLEDERPITVRVPAIGGLAASICDCKAATCAHRALAVLAARRRHGMPDVASDVQVLDDHQRVTVLATEDWAVELVTLGLVGLSLLLLDRGAALVTELRQCDLPRPANLLARAVASAERIRSGLDARSPAALQGHLSELWAVLSGLQTSPPPASFLELAGTHRRYYRVCPELDLILLGPEIWQTTTGFRGYSLHFLEAAGHRFVSLSEARGPGQDPTWRPMEALGAAELADRRLGDLAPRRFTVQRAAVSHDGRLASRRSSRLGPSSPVSGAEIAGLARDVADLRSRFSGAIEAHPIRLPDPQWGLVACARVEAPRFDPYRDQWIAAAVDSSGEAFTLLIEEAEVAARVEESRSTLSAVFGSASLGEDGIALRPVLLVTPSRVSALTVPGS